LGKRLPVLVGEDVLTLPGRNGGKPTPLEGFKDHRVIAAIDFARSGLRRGFDTSPSRGTAAPYRHRLAPVVEPVEPKGDDLVRTSARAEPDQVEVAVERRDGFEE